MSEQNKTWWVIAAIAAAYFLLKRGAQQQSSVSFGSIAGSWWTNQSAGMQSFFGWATISLAALLLFVIIYGRSEKK